MSKRRGREENDESGRYNEALESEEIDNLNTQPDFFRESNRKIAINRPENIITSNFKSTNVLKQAKSTINKVKTKDGLSKNSANKPKGNVWLKSLERYHNAKGINLTQQNSNYAPYKFGVNFIKLSASKDVSGPISERKELKIATKKDVFLPNTSYKKSTPRPILERQAVLRPETLDFLKKSVNYFEDLQYGKFTYENVLESASVLSKFDELPKNSGNNYGFIIQKFKVDEKSIDTKFNDLLVIPSLQAESDLPVESPKVDSLKNIKVRIQEKLQQKKELNGLLYGFAYNILFSLIFRFTSHSIPEWLFTPYEFITYSYLISCVFINLFADLIKPSWDQIMPKFKVFIDSYNSFKQYFGTPVQKPGVTSPFVLSAEETASINKAFGSDITQMANIERKVDAMLTKDPLYKLQPGEALFNTVKTHNVFNQVTSSSLPGTIVTASGQDKINQEQSKLLSSLKSLTGYFSKSHCEEALKMNHLFGIQGTDPSSIEYMDPAATAATMNYHENDVQIFARFWLHSKVLSPLLKLIDEVDDKLNKLGLPHLKSINQLSKYPYPRPANATNENYLEFYFDPSRPLGDNMLGCTRTHKPAANFNVGFGGLNTSNNTNSNIPQPSYDPSKKHVPEALKNADDLNEYYINYKADIFALAHDLATKPLALARMTIEKYLCHYPTVIRPVVLQRLRELNSSSLLKSFRGDYGDDYYPLDNKVSQDTVPPIAPTNLPGGLGYITDTTLLLNLVQAKFDLALGPHAFPNLYTNYFSEHHFAAYDAPEPAFPPTNLEDLATRFQEESFASQLKKVSTTFYLRQHSPSRSHLSIVSINVDGKRLVHDLPRGDCNLFVALFAMASMMLVHYTYRTNDDNLKPKKNVPVNIFAPNSDVLSLYYGHDVLNAETKIQFQPKVFPPGFDYMDFNRFFKDVAANSSKIKTAAM